MIIHIDANGEEIARYRSWAEFEAADIVRQDGDTFVVRDRQAPWAEAGIHPDSQFGVGA